MELKTILLVDEKSPIFANIGCILRDQGYLVMLAPDARTACVDVQNYHFDLILVSFVGKEIDKLNLIGHVKKNSPQAKLIVVGHPEMPLPMEVFQCEVDDYFLAPSTSIEFSRRVDRCLKRDKIVRDHTGEKADAINGHILNSLRLKIRDIHNGLLSLQAHFNTLIYQDFRSADLDFIKVDELSQNLSRLTGLTENILYNMLICCNEDDVSLIQEAWSISKPKVNIYN